MGFSALFQTHFHIHDVQKSKPMRPLRARKLANDGANVDFSSVFSKRLHDEVMWSIPP